jgi:HSP20 family protein
MLMRTDPFRRFDRLFEEPSSFTAAMDAYRQGDVITVQFDLPGVDPESIDLQIERGELRLEARRRAGIPDDAQFLVRERTEASITRRLMLGDVLDVEHVDAEYRDGVLTLRIPLHERAKPRKVDVRRGQSESDEKRAITVESS